MDGESTEASEKTPPITRHRHRHRSYGPFRRWLARRCEYLVLLLTVAVTRCLPRRLALWLGELTGGAARWFGVRRRIVRCNLSFVGYEPNEQQRIERQLYRTIGRYVADMIRSGNRPFVVEAGGTAVVDQAGKAGTGVLLLFSHLGNWEFLMPALAHRLPTAVVVAKPMRNPLVNDWLEKLRSRLAPGIHFVPPANALRQSLRSLRAGGMAAFAIDQYAGSSGLPARFLGHETSTVRSTAGIESRTGCQVLGAYAILGTDNTYHVVVEPLPSAPAAATVSEILERHNDLISDWVRQYPEHWFGWFHRRFKDVVQYD